MTLRFDLDAKLNLSRQISLFRTVLLSIQALLAAPEPDDPQDAVVARQYQDNFHIFKATAQHWATVYAGSNYKVRLKLKAAINL